MTSTIASPQEGADVRVVTPASLDLEAFTALQLEVFGPVLADNGISKERLGRDVFAWKLDGPEEPGRIAVATGAGRLLAACAIVPTTLASGSARARGWQVVDAATTSKARGRGLFRQLLDALISETAPTDWLYAFPNGQSRRTFERAGFTSRVRVPLWFRPTVGRVRRPDGLEEVTRFGVDQDRFAERFAERAGLTALRSARYLAWRYLRHPFFTYRCFQLLAGGEVEGVLVVNPMKARGRTSLWVMELVALSPGGRRTLARAARWLAQEERCDVVLSMAEGRLPGAARMPPCFLEKRHALMVRPGRGGGEAVPPFRWTVETGDWDTF